MIDKFIFFSPLTELMISVYVLGWGLLISEIFYEKKDIKKNLSEISIFGFCLILPIVQLFNLFFPISNIFFYISFVFSFAIIIKFKNIINKELISWLVKLALIFIILIPIKYTIKGNEDLYYHLPKIELLNNSKIIFGIAHYDPSLSFTNGWAYISSIFNFFNGSIKNLYLSSFVFFILSIMTLYNYLKISNYNNLKIFLLILISFLIIKFYRIQEFGNDYHAIILLLISQFLIFKFYLSKKNDTFLLNKILFYSFFAIMLRIYSLFIIPVLFILLLKNVKIKYLINKKLLVLFFITFSMTTVTSFINSGCFFMPVKSTCVNNQLVSWSYFDKIDDLNLRLKSFNTNYFSYKKEVEFPVSEKEWVKNFNWFSYHIQSERFLLPLIKTFILINLFFVVSLILFNNKNLHSRTLILKDYLFILLTLSSFILWLVYTPLLRAGGYSYWPFLILSVLLFKFDFKEIINFKKIKIFLAIIISISVLLNFNRIYKEGFKYSSFSPFFFTQWGKFHHTKYQEKEILIDLLAKKKDIKNFDLNFKLKSSHNYWFITQ